MLNDCKYYPLVVEHTASPPPPPFCRLAALASAYSSTNARTTILKSLLTFATTNARCVRRVFVGAEKISTQTNKKQKHYHWQTTVRCIDTHSDVRGHGRVCTWLTHGMKLDLRFRFGCIGIGTRNATLVCSAATDRVEPTLCFVV